MANMAGNMATGAPMPQQPQGMMTATPGNTNVGDPKIIIQMLKDAIAQSVDEKGYVDINQLAAIWPQITQKTGVQIPLQAVLAMLKENPDLIDEIIVNMGLAGMKVNGQIIGPEQLMGG